MEHYYLSDRELMKRFENLTLNPELFNHEAHLRLAWIHIREFGRVQAEENLCAQIERFDAAFGDGTKFHHTLTVASVKMVAHFVGRSRANNFQSFMREFPRLRSHFQDLLDQHYGIDLLTHPTAKEEYVEPDRLAFT